MQYYYRRAGGVSGDRALFVQDVADKLAQDLGLRHRPRIQFVEPADGPTDLPSWAYRVVGWFQPALTISRSMVYLRADLDDPDTIHGLAEELRHHYQLERGTFPRRAQGGPLPRDHPCELDAERYAYGDICRRVFRRHPCRLCNLSQPARQVS